MKISPLWLRDFVDLRVDHHRLADDLTLAGIAVESVIGDGESAVFEMDITTNRPDAMNHFGVARECAAIYDLALKAIEPKLPGVGADTSPPSIEIENGQECARFTARVLRGVTIKPSPAGMVQRLAWLDQRAINNAVDATNYTLWEMGKPTHVFDLDLLEGGKIVVRRARDGEKLKTLDGVERTLTSEDLVVADARKPVGLAGVMGGYDTMITEKTKNILIESAWWDPTIVRKMSKRHGLHTDASHRFERGADFESTVLSCNRVAELILQSGGGELVGDVIDVVARKLDQAPIGLRLSEVHRILGEKLETNEIFGILKHLGFDLMPERGGDPDFTVRIPSWRMDVEREIDLIEEIARLHGYDKFPNTLPSYAGGVVDSPDASKDSMLRSSLLALGYNEAISSSFISRQDAEMFSTLPVLELANPLSEEASVMRTSMLPGMLSMLAYNLNRGSNDVRLFEAANVFSAAGSTAVQVKRICLGMTGNVAVPGVHQAGRAVSFFDPKGDIEDLLHPFDCKNLAYEAGAGEYYHPGRSARAIMDGATVAVFGQIHPDVASARKLRQDVFVGEIYLDLLYRHGLRQARYEALPRFPGVERDFSFVFADSVTFESIQQTVLGLRLSELRTFAPAEIFRGGSVPRGNYSILLRANFQSGERTLREDEVAKWAAAIVKTLEQSGGTLRA